MVKHLPNMWRPWVSSPKTQNRKNNPQTSGGCLSLLVTGMLNLMALVGCFGLNRKCLPHVHVLNVRSSVCGSVSKAVEPSGGGAWLRGKKSVGVGP